MPRAPTHDQVIGWLLLVACARTAWASLEPPPQSLLAGPRPPPILVPDLARDGWVRLAWLPGIGPERARRIVAERPHLGVPLTPATLPWLPGIGATLATGCERQLAAWRARAADDADRGAKMPG